MRMWQGRANPGGGVAPRQNQHRMMMMTTTMNRKSQGRRQDLLQMVMFPFRKALASQVMMGKSVRILVQELERLLVGVVVWLSKPATWLLGKRLWDVCKWRNWHMVFVLGVVGHTIRTGLALYGEYTSGTRDRKKQLREDMRRARQYKCVCACM